MKKTIAVAGLGVMLFLAIGAQAQNSPTNEATQKLIQSIPSLKASVAEVTAFESKVEGKKENFEHANADLKALKMKYASALNLQISMESSKENQDLLKAELERVNKEIANIK
jgi:Skp family chaperone for outer membrane proteins